MNCKNKKRMLIVAYDGFGNSGVPYVIKNIVDAFWDIFDIDIVYFEKIDFYTKYFEEKCNKLFYLEMPTYQGKIKKAYWHFLKKNTFLYHFFFDHFFANNTYDVIHSFKEFDTGPIFKAAKKRGIQKRILHCNVIHNKPYNLIQRILFLKDKKATLKYSSCLIGVSQKCCEIAFKGHDYHVIHNPVDVSSFNSINCSLNDSTLHLLQVANFCTNKNQLFSLDVLTEIIKLKSDAKLFFVGREIESGYYSKMISKIKHNNLENNIVFIKHDADRNDYIPQTSLYIIPSFNEGASIVAIEAQAAGVNVVASSSLSQDINAGGCIFLDLNSGAKKWANSILSFFSKNKNSRHNYVLTTFSPKSFKEKLKNIYNN